MTTHTRTLLIALAGLGATLAAAWYALGLIPAGITGDSKPPPPLAIIFIPSATSRPEALVFDLSTKARYGADLVASRDHIIHFGHGWSVPEDGTLTVRQPGKVVMPISGSAYEGNIRLHIHAPGNPDPGSSIRDDAEMLRALGYGVTHVPF